MTQTILQDIRGVMTQIAPLPTGIDPTRSWLWGNRGQYDYEYCRSVIGASVQALNEERAVAWGDLIALTTEQEIHYMQGGSVGPVDKTMGRKRPPQHKAPTFAGHMIDLAVWEDSFGGDTRDLEDMTEAQLIGSVVSLVTGFRDRFDYEILNRALTNTHVQLGSTGYNVGFCDADTTVKYGPRKYNGKVFYEDHNHFAGYNSSNSKTFDDVITGLALLVAEHGLPLNTDFKVYVSETDVTTWRALTNYVMPVADVTIDRGGATSGNQFFEQGSVGPIPNSGGRYIGAYNTAYGFAQLFATPRIATGYALLYRPGTAFAANNALALRYRESTGYGLRIKEIPDFNTTFPVKEIDLEDEYGVGGGKVREAGAVGYLVAGGVWANPTLSL